MVYRTRRERSGRHRIEVAQVGVVEKAVAAAKGLWKSRQDMYSQVYWQHTARAMKVMLAELARRVLIQEEAENSNRFLDAFHDWVCGDLTLPIRHLTDSAREALTEEVDFLHTGPSTPPGLSCLSPADDSLILLLECFSKEEDRALGELLRKRRIFGRIAVLSHNREPDRYEGLYDRFRGYLRDDNLQAIQAAQRVWGQAILQRLADVLDEEVERSPIHSGSEETLHQMSSVSPLILVDVPVKSAGVAGPEDRLWYVPEDMRGVHSRQGSYPRFENSEVNLEARRFDHLVGKIRVFCHPDWCDLLTEYLDPETVLDSLTY